MNKFKITILLFSLIFCFKNSLATKKTQKEEPTFKKNEELVLKENLKKEEKDKEKTLIELFNTKNVEAKKTEKDKEKEQPKEDSNVLCDEETIEFFNYNGAFTFF